MFDEFSFLSLLAGAGSYGISYLLGSSSKEIDQQLQDIGSAVPIYERPSNGKAIYGYLEGAYLDSLHLLPNKLLSREIDIYKVIRKTHFFQKYSYKELPDRTFYTSTYNDDVLISSNPLEFAHQIFVTNFSSDKKEWLSGFQYYQFNPDLRSLLPKVQIYDKFNPDNGIQISITQNNGSQKPFEPREVYLGTKEVCRGLKPETPLTILGSFTSEMVSRDPYKYSTISTKSFAELRNDLENSVSSYKFYQNIFFGGSIIGIGLGILSVFGR